MNDNFRSFMKLVLKPPVNFISNEQQRKEFTMAIILNMVTIWRIINDMVFGQKSSYHNFITFNTNEAYKYQIISIRIIVKHHDGNMVGVWEKIY